MSKSNEFNNLPLVQVDLKVTLSQPCVLTALTLLTSAELMRAKYSAVVNDLSDELPPGIGVLPELPNTLQHVRFIAPERSVTATIHTQMVAARWTDINEGQPYPRYDAMVSELDWIINTWQVTKDQAAFPVAQIAYQNFIEDEGRPDPLWFLNQGSLKFDFPGLVNVGDYQLGFRVDQADVRVAVTAAVRSQGGKEKNGLLLQTIVGTVEPLGTWKQMMDLCHDKSNDLFSSILSEEAKERWQYVTG